MRRRCPWTVRGTCRLTGLLLASALALGAGACREAGGPPERTQELLFPETGGPPTRPIEEVLKEAAPRLIAIEGIVGVYQGRLDDGSDCITLMLERGDADLEARLPREIEGYPVVVEVSGAIRPLQPRDRGTRS